MRTASNKSSIVSPSLSLASIVVASWSVLFRSISKSSWKSFVFPLDSSSFFFKSSVLVQPSSISYTQSRFLSRQHWYVGRWPVHFAFRFWHRVQALRTCSGGPRVLLDGPCLLVSADDRDFRFTGWDENSGAWASQMRSRPLLRQVWHVGRSPEHLDSTSFLGTGDMHSLRSVWDHLTRLLGRMVRLCPLLWGAGWKAFCPIRMIR